MPTVWANRLMAHDGPAHVATCKRPCPVGQGVGQSDHLFKEAGIAQFLIL